MNARTVHRKVLGNLLASAPIACHQDGLTPLPQPTVLGSLERLYQSLALRLSQLNPDHSITLSSPLTMRHIICRKIIRGMYQSAQS